MRRPTSDVLFHGFVGGLMAGAVVAVWFLAVDAVAGDPLHTPAELGRVLFRWADGTSTAGMAAAYTPLHFGVFALLGLVAAGFLEAFEIPAGWLVGLVFGLGVLNAVHYTGLLITDAELLMVLPWPHVVGANLVAGLALMTYLHRATGQEGPLGLATLRGRPLLAEGAAAGLAGAAAVALWFFLLDVAAGEPFRTPAALGSAVLLGATSPAEVVVSPAVVLAYTVVHLAAFWAVGIGLAWVAGQLERAPALVYLALLAFIVVEAVSFGFLVTLGQWVVGELSVWAVGVGNLLGVAAMVWWLWRGRPDLRDGLAREGFTSAA